MWETACAPSTSTRAVTVGHLDHLTRWRDRPESIRHLAERYDLRAWAQQFFVLLKNDLAAIIYRGHAQAGALLRTEHLPRNDVGMVLKPCDDDLVVLVDIAASPRLRDEVDALGGAANEYDFASPRSIQEAARFFTRALVSIRGPRCERVGGTVYVGVLVTVEGRKPVDYRIRFLGSGGVVEPD